jgi:hypothetical protein
VVVCLLAHERRAIRPCPFAVPGGLTAAECRLEPLGQNHNVADYAASRRALGLCLHRHAERHAESIERIHRRDRDGEID